jgi:hypothetical protein
VARSGGLLRTQTFRPSRTSQQLNLTKEPATSHLQPLFSCDEDALANKAKAQMTTPSLPTDNPFVDPVASFEEHGREHSFAIDSTLPVGRNASLTLGTDSLIVLGTFTVIIEAKQY